MKVNTFMGTIIALDILAHVSNFWQERKLQIQCIWPLANTLLQFSEFMSLMTLMVENNKISTLPYCTFWFLFIYVFFFLPIA